MRILVLLLATAAPTWAQNAVRVVRPVPVLPFAPAALFAAPSGLSAPAPVLPSGAKLTAAPSLAPTLALPPAAVNAVSARQAAVAAEAVPVVAAQAVAPALGVVPAAEVSGPAANDAAPLPVNRKALSAAARASARTRTRAKGVSQTKVPSAAAAATFFDGASEFPEMVESAAVDGFVRELREPARVLREMGVQGTVTVYGSARIPSPEKAKAAYDAAVAKYGGRPRTAVGKKALSEARAQVRASRWYAEAQRFGALVVEKSGGKLAVVSGGGPGIMEGANRGAFEAGGKSVGYNILLPHEQSANPYLTKGLSFDFTNFTTRKMNLRHGAMGLAYFPGGFGTMDELFEVLTLMQTGKMPKVPIVLVGEKSYWNKILRFREFAHQGLISKADLDLFEFAETAEEAWSAIESHYKK
ncbi:TIGR00730 family Rossman fold protein [bacterium]|nr:MAG: TIGR00730 family Rossman fold protein [bacterium]